MLLKIYIILCGLTLIIAGVVGYYNNINPTLEFAVFGQGWFADNAQNVFHIVLGVFTLLIGALAHKHLQKILAWIFSLASMALAVYSLVYDTLLNLFGLEKPGDTLFYLLLGSAGLLSLTITIIYERGEELEILRRKFKV